MTIEIPLSSGDVAFIDDADFELVSRVRWHLKTRGNDLGRYARANGPKGTAIYMHRLILQPNPGLLVDHIDGNGLNNVRSNLRLCSNKENTRSRHHKPRSISGFFGVGYLPWVMSAGRRIPRPKPWFAHVCVDGKTIRGGYFTTPEEAARKRDQMALHYHGEFATLNFKVKHA